MIGFVFLLIIWIIKRNIGEVFPSLKSDGGLMSSVLSDTSNGPAEFTIRDHILYVQDKKTSDIMEATIIIPPTTKYNIVMLVDFFFCP